MAEVASKRVARRRGVKGFANARDVRNLFEQSYMRALDRIERERKRSKMAEKKRQSSAPEASGAPASAPPVPPLAPRRTSATSSASFAAPSAPAGAEEPGTMSVGCAVLLAEALVPGYEDFLKDKRARRGRARPTTCSRGA